MKIAIIGSGISGLTSAYLLQDLHDIQVFEQNDAIGGHTATINVDWKGKSYAVDTGFIVFNDRTYPNFIKLMDRLGVASQNTEMSFSVSCDQSGLEYSGSDLNGFFAQRRNIVSRQHWKMLTDILRFNREAQAELDAGTLPEAMTLGEYLHKKGYGAEFIEKFLVPMGSAIWSASIADMMEFPLLFFVRFFSHHGLLTIKDRPQWKVIQGGSKAYLQPLTAGFKDRIRCGVKLKTVRRFQTSADENSTSAVELVFENGDTETFDQVIFACHSDQALALLEVPTEQEQQILGAIPYAMNEVVLHTDKDILPTRERAWASWNYRLGRASDESASLSYNMNILQGIDANDTFVVTLNATERLNPDKILGTFHYAHPQFTVAGIAAQQRWAEISGVNNTWFCGAYWRNGFHEDGCWSGVRTAQALGAKW